MLTCIPQSLCSWDFRVVGTSAGTVELTFNFFSEQGSIRIDGAEIPIRKHGPLSGYWTLERDGQVVADGKKPNAMFRSFNLRVAGADINLTLKAQSAFTRSYDILADEKAMGVIQPAHAFTRRAYIKCSPEVPEIAQLFAFWLAVITWRREANNNGGH